MPCYRCGSRQSDPERGKASPWKRAVRREHQVLICPDCAEDALADLDGCDRCGGTRLIRRLDQIECLDCGLAREADPAREVDPVRETGTEPPPEPAAAPSASAVGPAAPCASAAPAASAPSGEPLAEEVTRALDRVLHRNPD
jgi:hypothetical protein